MKHPLLAAAGLCLLALAMPALAADVAAVGDKAVIVPYGDWITAAGQTVSAILNPVLAGVAATAIYNAAPWARLFLSQALIERMVQNALGYALNAIGGAAKDKVLTVSVGSAVIAKAAQRAIDVAPGWLVKEAGGPHGVAEKLFRALHLEPDATAANTLAPALNVIPKA